MWGLGSGRVFCVFWKGASAPAWLWRVWAASKSEVGHEGVVGVFFCF